MRTPRWLALLALSVPALLAIPAGAATVTGNATWTQYQGDASRSGLAPAGTPGSPYAVSWRAAAGVGDPSQLLGIPTPLLTGDLAIVLGRETVEAVEISSGEQSWSVPRALGPSTPASIEGDTLVFVEGGGEEATASGSPSPTPSTSPTSASASVSPSASRDLSTLVGMRLANQKRVWSLPLTGVSHSGVLVSEDTAVVATDDGSVTAVDLNGTVRWTQDIGDRVLTPLAAAGDLAFASVQPEGQGAPALVALRLRDGSEAWRYEPPVPVLNLGGPSVDATGAMVYVTADASVRAVSAADGSSRWAAALYSPTQAAPAAVSTEAVVVADQSGTVYAFDPSTGAERWRFATNHSSASPPVIVGASVVQPANDGTVSAIDLPSGHQVWHTSIADSAVLGIAAAPDVLVASVTGTAPGLVGLGSDPTGVTEDLVSPTVADPVALVTNWIVASLPLTVLLFLLGRTLASRTGPAEFEVETEEGPVDPWEDVGDET